MSLLAQPFNIIVTDCYYCTHQFIFIGLGKLKQMRKIKDCNCVDKQTHLSMSNILDQWNLGKFDTKKMQLGCPLKVYPIRQNINLIWDQIVWYLVAFESNHNKNVSLLLCALYLINSIQNFAWSNKQGEEILGGGPWWSS